MTTSTFGAFAATCDSDLRFIPCDTRKSAKQHLDVTTGGGLEGWDSFGVECDELGDLLDSAAHQPQAIGINLSLTGDACLDCYDEGWLADLAHLAETSVADLREELGQLSRFTSHRAVVGKQQAVKFLFCLPAEVLEELAAFRSPNPTTTSAVAFSPLASRWWSTAATTTRALWASTPHMAWKKSKTLARC